MVAVAIASMLVFHWVTVTRLFGPAGSLVRRAGDVASVAVATFIVFIFLRPIGQFIYFQF
jgi:hypothetical protein